MVALTVIGVILAGLRVGGVTHIAFQAVAHLFLGYIIRDGWRGWNRETVRQYPTRLAIVLSIVETIMAVITRL